MFPTSQSIPKLVLLAATAILINGCVVLKPRVKADFVEPTTGMEFVYVKGGTYMMGDSIGDGHSRERPSHQVTIKDMAVGIYEVTFAEYDAFCTATGREKPSDEGWGRGDMPVINVSWHDAMDFANWASEQSGMTLSLPTEAQWEYFSRAGTSTRYWAGENIPPNSAQCKDCNLEGATTKTAITGTFLPNPWKVADTLGNVSEWCVDSVNKNYVGAPQNDQPWSDGNNERAIHRGGSWKSPKFDLRSSGRDYSSKDTKRHDIGFRLVILNPSFSE